jgi:hypothetical protein
VIGSDGLEDETEAVLFLEQLILLKRIRAARTRPEPSVRSVKREEHLRPWFQLVRMRASVEVVVGEMAGVEFDQRLALHPKALAIRRAQFQPAHIRLVAVLLGHDVRHVLFADRAPIPANHRGGLAVGVIFQWPKAVPFQVLQRGGKRHRYPNPRDVAQAVSNLNAIFDVQLAGREQRIARGMDEIIPLFAPAGFEDCLDGWCFAFHKVHTFYTLVNLVEFFFQPAMERFPRTQHQLESVIIGSRAPDVQPRPGDDKVITGSKLYQQTAVFVEDRAYSGRL